MGVFINRSVRMLFQNFWVGAELLPRAGEKKIKAIMGWWNQEVVGKHTKTQTHFIHQHRWSDKNYWLHRKGYGLDWGLEKKQTVRAGREQTKRKCFFPGLQWDKVIWCTLILFKLKINKNTWQGVNRSVYYTNISWLDEWQSVWW